MVLGNGFMYCDTNNIEFCTEMCYNIADLTKRYTPDP